MSLGQLKVMSAIEQCRSAALGGHVERCQDCGHSRIAYNSCRNRHCPKCQGAAAKDWLVARQADLLPVGYFHLVFTLPAEIAPIAYQNKAVVYDLLFRTAAETLLAIAADPRHLGARIGFTAVLHTWGSAMTHHPHIHLIVPGGGIWLDGTRWVRCRPGFLVPVRVLSRLFRRLFLTGLAEAHTVGRLAFFGDLDGLPRREVFATHIAPLSRKNWFVYAKPPFQGPEAVLMRLIGLVAVYQRPNTSKPAAAHKVYPYLLGGLSIDRVNQVWCSDITYIPMAKGFVYLVAIMDWHSRAVLAWRLSNTLGADFCVEALEEALARFGRPEIFNTDQGSQFTSDDFTGVLSRHEVTISMDGKGRCMDNVFIERLWRSLKYEEVYLHAYGNVAAAKAGIRAWLVFYNEERQHQSHGYRTPRQVYEAQCRWICGRSALPTGCASPTSRARSKSGEMLAFAHIPTGTTTNTRIDQKGFDGKVTSPSMAIGADIEIRGATP